MRATKETARKDARTSRRDATKNANTAKGAVWRTVATKRGVALRSPDGRLFYGTAQEVRDAALMPWRRNALARSLNLHRHCRDCGTFDAAEFAECCAASRREAIHFGRADALIGVSVHIPAATYIKMLAGSRLVRDDFDEYLAELWDGEVSAFIDVARSDTGRPELPLTRHERAALERLRRGSGA